MKVTFDPISLVTTINPSTEPVSIVEPSTKGSTFIGVRKGTLDLENKEKFLKGETFFFNGSSNDFVVLPK